MKRYIILLISIITFALIFITGCIEESNVEDDTNIKTSISLSLVTNTSNTIPEISANRNPSVREPLPLWGIKTNMGETFNVFREYDNILDNGVVDGQNIYKVLSDIEETFSYSMNSATEFATPKTISTTYNFGDGVTETYTHGVDSQETEGLVNYRTTLAYKIEGGFFYGILGATMKGGEQDYVESLKFKYNETTGEIELNETYHINYISGSMIGETYGVRSTIIGNMNTHSFFVHVQTGNVITMCSQIIGKGISQGTNNFYAVYIKNSNESSNEGYYIIPSGSDETYFEDRNANDRTADTYNTSFPGADVTQQSYIDFIEDYIQNGDGLYTTDLSDDDYANDGLLVL